MTRFATLAALVLLLAAAPARGAEKDMVCNGSPLLCDKTLVDITLWGGHNSYCSTEDGFAGPNHAYGLTRQMQDGARLMVLDVHVHKGESMLCHGDCRLGKKPHREALREIKTFLDKHPNEVFVFAYEMYATGDMIKADFEATGLMDRLAVIPKTGPWPTLRQMITTGKQLVLLTGKDAYAFPGYHHEKDLWVGTGWGYKSIDAFECDKFGKPLSPAPHQLYSLNHQYVDALGISNKKLSAKGNKKDVILEHLRRCEKEKGHRVNLMDLDFYHLGEVDEAIREYNGLPPAKKP